MQNIDVRDMGIFFTFDVLAQFSQVLQKPKYAFYVQPVLFLRAILEIVVWFLFSTEDISHVNAMSFE